jgi:hypothetical protein
MGANVLRTGLVPPSEYLNVQMSAETYKTQISGIRLVRCYKYVRPTQNYHSVFLGVCLMTKDKEPIAKYGKGF